MHCLPTLDQYYRFPRLCEHETENTDLARPQQPFEIVSMDQRTMFTTTRKQRSLAVSHNRQPSNQYAPGWSSTSNPYFDSPYRRAIQRLRSQQLG